MADGWISEDGYVRISLKSSDEDHLRQFADLTGVRNLSHFEKKFNMHGDKKIFPAVSYSAKCKQFSKDLNENWGIPYKNKSSVAEGPWHIKDEELRAAFAAGLIDGDGCYSSAQYSSSRRPSITLIGTEDICKWFANFADTENMVRRRADSRAFAISVTGNEAILTRERMHSVEVDFLERKVDAWERQGCNLEILDLGPKHGTRNMYEKHKCRCDKCKQFYSEYNKKQWARRRLRANV